jgi:hypothetical protein
MENVSPPHADVRSADILSAAGEGTFCHPSFEKWHPKKTPASLRDDGV